MPIVDHEVEARRFGSCFDLLPFFAELLDQFLEVQAAHFGDRVKRILPFDVGVQVLQLIEVIPEAFQQLVKPALLRIALHLLPVPHFQVLEVLVHELHHLLLAPFDVRALVLAFKRT